VKSEKYSRSIASAFTFTSSLFSFIYSQSVDFYVEALVVYSDGEEGQMRAGLPGGFLAGIQFEEVVVEWAYHLLLWVQITALAERSLLVGAHIFEGTPAAVGLANQADTEGRAWQPHGEQPAYRNAGFGCCERGEEGVGQCQRLEG